MNTFFTNKKINLMIVACITLLSMDCVAQQQTLKPDLSKTTTFRVINRQITVLNEQGKNAVHLDAKPGDGVAWTNNITFEKGIIEFDVKGKNVLQQSFVGIAFHGLNDSTFDAIYFVLSIFSRRMFQEKIIRYNMFHFRNLIGLH